MSTTKQIIENWFKTKNYDQGVEILFAFRPHMARIFRGREKTYAGKLEYELKKIAGIPTLVTNVTPAQPVVVVKPKRLKPKTFIKVKPQPTQSPKEPPVSDDSKVSAHSQTRSAKHKAGTPSPELPETRTEPTVKPTPKNQTPAFIAHIVKEHARLFKLRSQLSDEREKIPQKNHPTLNKKRKILSESIQQHSERIEKLYNAKEDYYNKGIKPDMEALFPSEPTQPERPEPKTPKKK